MRTPPNGNRKTNLFSDLRQRLFLLVLLAVIPALSIIFFNARHDRHESIARLQEDAQRIVQIAGVRQGQFVAPVKELLHLLAGAPAIRSGHPESCRGFLKDVLERNPRYANLGVLDAEGKIRCSAVATDPDADYNQRSYFRQARDLKGFAIGDYQLDRITAKDSLDFGYPVLDPSGQVEGVVYAALDLGWLIRLYADVHLVDGATLTLVDSRGIMLTRSPAVEQWSGKPVPDAPLFELLRLRPQSAVELSGADGVERLYAFARLDDGAHAGHLHAIVAIGKDIASAEADRRFLRNLAGLALAALAALGAAWLIGNRVVGSFFKQHADVQEISMRLAAIVQSSEDAIIGMSLDGRIVSWNDGAEMMYGYSAEETKGLSITILSPPERSSELPQVLAIINQGKGINRFETERVRKDGRRLYVSSSISPIRDQHGRIVGASIIARDITALRKVDEQLRAHAGQLETLCRVAQEVGGTLALEEVLQRALSRVASASGFDFAFVRFSREMAGRMSYGAGREGQRTELAGLFERLGGHFEQRLQATTAPWFIEDMTMTPDLARAGVASQMKAVAVLPLSGNEEQPGVLILMSPRRQTLGAEEWQFLQALSQQIGLAIRNAQLYETTVRINEDLQGEIEERKRAEKTLADFTAMVVHDLRSPLSNVVSIAESLQDGLFGPVSEQQSTWLWKIENNCKGLIAHVSDFLDFSKIEAGRIDLIKAPVDFESLLQESLLEYSIQAEKKNIALRTDIGVLPTVHADARRLAQVMSNLLSNALKFTQPGGAIRVGAHSGDMGIITAWVKDTGTGMQPDEIAYIFETYRQASGGRLSSQTGTGLGLTICKKIVEAHGGKIWVESAEGKGSTFFFSLPPGEEPGARSDLPVHHDITGSG